MKKILFVGGTFDDTGGRPSKIAEKLKHTITHDDIFWMNRWLEGEYRTDRSIEAYNGGEYRQLEGIVANADHDAVFWFPDIPNNKEKLLPMIKRNNPSCTLVTSKRNEGQYGLADVIAHGLRNHSNLLLEIKTDQEPYVARVLDPLGNLYYEGTDFSDAGRALRWRTEQLMKITRVSSKRIGDVKAIPANEEFFTVVRGSAERFHNLIRSIAHQERFVGNASFRCENGFPSFRDADKGLIYVSRRNIDKRQIGPEGFIACEQGNPIKFYGDQKPSVDTPIHLALYDALPNINYLLHGHVYIYNAPHTTQLIPCGALEEAREILNIVPAATTRFSLNLAGHGCIIGSDRPEGLKGHLFVPRPTPEDQTERYMRRIGYYD